MAHLVGIVEIPGADSKHCRCVQSVGDSESRHDLLEINIVERFFVAGIWYKHRHERAGRGMVAQNVGLNSRSSQPWNYPGFAGGERQVPNSPLRIRADAENIPADAEIDRQSRRCLEFVQPIKPELVLPEIAWRQALRSSGIHRKA